MVQPDLPVMWVLPGTPFAKPLLRAIGVPEFAILIYDPHCVYHADELFVVTGLNEQGDYPSAETLSWVRSALASTLESSVSDVPVMVLIERQGSERVLENACEMEQAMRAVAPVGFQVVTVTGEGHNVLCREVT